VRKNDPGEQLSISRRDEKTLSIAEFGVFGGQISHLVLGGVEVIPKFAGENARAQVFGYTMAPWPNRLEDGKYRMAGIDFQAPKLDSQNNANHGLLLDEKMEIVSHASDSLKLSHSFGQDAHYPFAIELELEFTLEENALLTRATATNNSIHAAPFAIGFHPYFLMGNEFTVSAGFTHQIATDDRMLPVSTKEVSRLDLNQDSLELATLDDCYFGSNEVMVTNSAGSFEIRGLENINYFMLYRPSARVFAQGSALAIEPMSHPANVFATDIASTQILPGESKSYSYEIRSR
jgi:aldose 1-epimerase